MNFAPIAAITVSLALVSCSQPHYTEAEIKAINDRRAATEAAREARLEASRAALTIELATALEESNSDYIGPHQAILLRTSVDLVERGHCTVGGFSDWGWNHTTRKSQTDLYFTQCPQGANFDRWYYNAATGTLAQR